MAVVVLPFCLAISVSTMRNRGRPSRSSSQAWIRCHRCGGYRSTPIMLAKSMTL